MESPNKKSYFYWFNEVMDVLMRKHNAYYKKLGNCYQELKPYYSDGFSVRRMVEGLTAGERPLKSKPLKGIDFSASKD